MPSAAPAARTWVGRVGRTLTVGALAAALAGCGDDTEQSARSGDPASPSGPSSEAPDPSASPPPSDGPVADFPLSADVDVAGASPRWAFPVVVRGWSRSSLDQNGVSQLTKDGSEATFTSYQLVQDGPGSDEENTRAYLSQFVADLRANPEITSVSRPQTSTATLRSDRGTLEFVQQELTYTTTAGGAYRSRFLARSLGKYVLSVHYAGPAADWSRAEWRRLVGAGLQALLPY